MSTQTVTVVPEPVKKWLEALTGAEALPLAGLDVLASAFALLRAG